MSFTVGIVAYHRPDSLRALLAPLVAGGVDAMVANVGHDPLVAAIAEDFGISLVGVDNLGYAAAVNALAASTASDVLVFANDDIRIDPAAAARLADVVATGGADVAVPRIVDPEGQLERTIQAVPGVGSLAREWLLLPDHPVRWLRRLRVEKWRAPAGPERVGAASAAIVAVSRQLLCAEPLPEAYFLYWEESEWFWRLRRRGAVVQYRPEVTCLHTGGRDDVRAAKSRLLARNAVRCIRRTQGRMAAALAVPVVIAWNARLMVGDSIRAVLHPAPARRARVGARWAGLGAACTSWGELR